VLPTQALVLAAAAAAQLAAVADAPRQRAGPYEIVLRLPPQGLYAGEEMEIEFEVQVVAPADPSRPPGPLLWAVIRGEADMPSMPSMPRFDELAHREGIPGLFGVHPTFPHGGEYRLCLTVLPPEIQPVGDPRPTVPLSFEFPLTVYDAVASPRRESAKVRPYTLDLILEPRHPVAGQPVEMELRVRHASSLDLREVTDFDVQHERLMHLFIVSSDRSRFAHEHPQPSGPGLFRLRYVFPAPGRYRVFADVAPKGAGSQVLSAVAEVGGEAPPPAVRRAPALRATLALPGAGVPIGKTVTIDAWVTDAKGRPVRDLQPWLGAMGHLLLLHEDAETFAHAHPDDRERGVGEGGRVPFLVRLPRPGSYKGWLQVQRKEKVETVEVEIVAVAPDASR
jgi:hypothetical protein